MLPYLGLAGERLAHPRVRSAFRDTVKRAGVGGVPDQRFVVALVRTKAGAWQGAPGRRGGAASVSARKKTGNEGLKGPTSTRRLLVLVTWTRGSRVLRDSSDGNEREMREA